MAEKAYYVTEEGREALEKELDYLKVVRRKEVAEKIKVALSFGDLSENSEYDEAKNDQAILEARIADLEVMLNNAKVIEKNEQEADKVHIGSTVSVSFKRENGAEATRELSIVGSNETAWKSKHPAASWFTRSSPCLNQSRAVGADPPAFFIPEMERKRANG